MTDKQLEKLGIYPSMNTLKPKKYWCEVTESYMIIHRDMTLKDIVTNIYAIGIEKGINKGKKQRSKQIMSLLNNDDINY